jgi:hypothetical protein
MIERRALHHLDDLSPEVRENITQQTQAQTAIGEQRSEIRANIQTDDMPKSVHRAFAAIGATNDLQYADEFAGLERIRRA